MEVTVILSGIPQCDPLITLNDLAYYLDKLFDTDDIGTFKVRELPNSNLVALDFSSGYDAMYAQNLLDGKSYSVNGIINVLRARVTHDPKLMPEEPLSQSLKNRCQSYVHSSSSIDDDSKLLPVTNKLLMKQDEEIDAKLKLLKIKKKAILMEEEQLLLEKEYLRKELDKLNESEHSSPKKRSRSHSSDSGEPKASSEKDRNKKSSRKLNNKRPRNKGDTDNFPCRLRDKDSRDLSDSCSREQRDSSSAQQADYSFDLRSECSRNLRDRSPRYLIVSRSRLTNYEQSCKLIKTSRSQDRSSSFTLRHESSRDRDHSYRRERDRDGSSRSKEMSVSSGTSSTSKNDKLRRPSRPQSRRGNESYENVHSATEYRRNISISDYHEKSVYSRKSQSDEDDELCNDSIIKDKITSEKIKNKKSVTNMEELRSRRDELKTKQDEAIKDILLELEKEFNGLCAKHKTSDAEKSKILSRLFEIVEKRIKSLRLTTAMTVSNLIMHYRCKYSKIEDKDLVTKLFSNLLATRNELPVSELPPSDRIWSVLDTVLQEFNLNSEEPNVEGETHEEEITNITINLNPISMNNKNETKKLYVVNNGHYYINITVDLNRRKRHYITTKYLLKELKCYMKQYQSYVKLEIFEYIIRIILEKRITELLKGKTYLKAKEIYDFYRQFYPQEEDENFVLQTLYEIWDGKYNDPVKNKDGICSPSEVHLAKVKEEIDNSESKKPTSDTAISVESQNVSVNTRESGIKKENEKEIKQENDKGEDEKGTSNKNTDVKGAIKTETVKSEEPPPNNNDVVLVESKVDVIDLSDTENKAEVIKTKVNTTNKEKSADNMNDLSREDDILQLNVSNEGEFDIAGDNTTQNSTEATVDKTSVSKRTGKIKCNASDQKDAKAKNKMDKIECNEIICLSDDDIEIIEVIDDKYRNPETDAKSNSELNSGHKSLEKYDKSATNSKTVFSVYIENKGNSTDIIDDYDDTSSVDTLILGEQTDLHVCDVSEQVTEELNVTNNSKENVKVREQGNPEEIGLKINYISGKDTENKEGNKRCDKIFEMVAEDINKTSAETNSDSVGDSTCETIEKIKRYLNLITGSVDDSKK